MGGRGASSGGGAGGTGRSSGGRYKELENRITATAARQRSLLFASNYKTMDHAYATVEAERRMVQNLQSVPVGATLEISYSNGARHTYERRTESRWTLDGRHSTNPETMARSIAPGYGVTIQNVKVRKPRRR